MRFSNEDVFWCRSNSFAQQPTKRLHLPYRSRRTLQRVIHHHHFAACSIAPLVLFISSSERNCRTKSEIRHIIRCLLHIILHHNHLFPFFHFFTTSKAKDAQPLPKVMVKQLGALLWKNFEEGAYATLAVCDVVCVETRLWIPFGDRTGFALFALVGGEHLPVDCFKVFSCEGYERRRRRTGRSQRSAAIADTIESTLERVSRTKTIPRTASFLIIAKRKKKSGKEKSKKDTTKDNLWPSSDDKKRLSLWDPESR